MQLSNLVFLAKTDTAIGFVSQDAKRLNATKQRDSEQPLITTVSSLDNISNRIPLKYKKMVRRSKKTTFILSNKNSFRLSNDNTHNILLNKLRWAYSTSANITGEEYNYEFALQNADVAVYPLRANDIPSILIKIGKSNAKRIR